MPKILIESDGTKKGTKLSIDGSKVNNLSEVSLSAFLDSEYSDDIWFSYTTRKKNKDKDMNVRTVYTYDPATASFKQQENAIDENNPTADDFSNM